jgi:hypothetical protein
MRALPFFCDYPAPAVAGVVNVPYPGREGDFRNQLIDYQ